MANDFFAKYQSKGGDDLETIAQQAAQNPPAAQDAPATQIDAPPQTAAQGAATPAADGSFHFTQDANNGFARPAASAAAGGAAAASYRQNARGKTVAGIPVVAIAAAVGALLLILILFFWFGRGKALPAMEGWSSSEVELWTSENKINLVASKEFSDSVDSGDVISQSIAAGERVKNGDFLTIVFSDGPDLSVLVDVPDIMSMTMAEVEAWADANFMTTVRMTTQTSDTVPSGSVIEYTINDNTVLTDQVRRDTPFYVIFSKGKSVGEAVKVPNFLTMSVAEAEAFATENKLVLVLEEEFSETVAKGNVIRQDVKAEQNVYGGDTITLTVSKGVEIIVPSFYGMSRELAAAKASQLGIQTLVSEKYSSSAKDALVSQSIKTGTLYQEDDIVELVYSLGNSISYTSFLGQNVADVFAWRDALNEDGATVEVIVQYTANSAAYGTIVDQSHLNTSIGITETIYLIASAGQPVTVPNFVQKAGLGYSAIITKADVVATCAQLGIVPIFIEEYASGRLYNEVWEQSIAAGSEMKQGDTIVIKVVPACIGTTVTVPTFTGKTLAQVKADASFNKFAITFVNESGVEITQAEIGATDTVKAQSEAAGSRVAEGFAITLTVQPAQVTATYAVPNFVGLTYSQAIAATNASQFVLKYEEENGKEITNLTDADTRTVTAQSIAAYGTQPQNTIIILTMSTLPAATDAGNATSDVDGGADAP